MKITKNIEKAVYDKINKFFNGNTYCFSIKSKSKGVFFDEEQEFVVQPMGNIKFIGQAENVDICVSKAEIADLFFKKIKKTKNKYYGENEK